MGIMEKKMETTIVYWGLYGDNGKENGNYYSTVSNILIQVAPSVQGSPSFWASQDPGSLY